MNFNPDVDEISDDGSTMLHAAARYGSLEVVEYLVAGSARGRASTSKSVRHFLLLQSRSSRTSAGEYFRSIENSESSS